MHCVSECIEHNGLHCAKCCRRMATLGAYHMCWIVLRTVSHDDRYLHLWHIFYILCFSKLASHNAKMFPNIIFLWSQDKNLLIKKVNKLESIKMRKQMQI